MGARKKDLGDIYPVCRALLGSTLWERIQEEIGASNQVEALPDTLSRDRGRPEIPDYLPDLARLERALFSAGMAEVPSQVESLCLNPTVQLVQIAWKNLPCYFNPTQERDVPLPEPANEVVVVWKSPGSVEVRVRTATKQDLLALKMVAEGISPGEAAAAANVQLSIVHAALDAAARDGILLAPASKIQRDLLFCRTEGSRAPDFFSASIFTLQWHITQDCNLHCKHCYDRSERKPLGLARARKILLGDLLRSYFRVDDQDDARRIREKRTGKLLTLDKSLAPTLPAFLSLLDVPSDEPEWPRLDPLQRRRRILDAVKRLLLRESRGQLDAWLGPFIERFGNSEGFMFYEVPMINAGYLFMRYMIDGGMRAGIPKDQHKHVVTMYGNVEKYTKELNIDPRYGHAFLLDREGMIRFQGQGYPNPETLKELFDAAEKLAQLQAGLRHAFAIQPENQPLAVDDVQLLERIAEVIVTRRMAASGDDVLGIHGTNELSGKPGAAFHHADH